MSFGEYVHYSWSGYKTHGANRAHDKHRSSFSASIFDKHRAQTQRKIDSIYQSPEILKRMENEYNKKIQNQYKIFKQLSNTAKNNAGLNKFQEVMAAVLGDINSNWSDPAIAVEIARGLEYDEATQQFVFNPPNNSMISLYVSGGGFPATPWVNQGSITMGQKGRATGYHYAKTVINYAKQVKEKIDARYTDDKSALDKIIQDCELIQNEVLTEAYQSAIHDQKLAVDKIKAKHVSAKEITKQINASLAEFLGNLAAAAMTQISEYNLIEAIQSAIESGGRRMTESTGMPDIVAINKFAASLTFDKNDISPSFTKTSNAKLKSDNNTVNYDYSIKELGGSRFQKSDVEISLDGTMHGLSIKNRDLTQLYYTDIMGQQKEVRIDAQTSSLMLYLLGIEQEQSKLGTHYLNILAEHKDAGSDPSFAQIHADAIHALSLYILYSALTGQGQLRKTKTATGMADIFVVHDKSTLPGTDGKINRARFYNIGAIIDDIMIGKDRDAIDPTLSSIKLSNEWHDDVILETGQNMAPSFRITKVLADARQKSIAVNISHKRLLALHPDTQDLR